MEELEDMSADDSSESLECSGRKMKPPDKKKYETDLEKLNSQIKQLETELRPVTSNKNQSSEDSLRSMKSEKQAHIERRSRIEAEIQTLNKDISKKTGELTKIQSTLAGYRTESRIDEAIRKLESQLRFTNFKVSEEKKIVAEIDSLRRSKKSLASFTHMKREVDALRDKQRKMRDERDRNYKSVTRIKQQEDEIRRKVQGDKARTETLRKDMNDLYDQKRLLNQEYKVAEKEYQQFIKDQRRRNKELFIRKKQEEKQEKDRAYQRAIEEYVASREPYEDEKLLCTNLITKLQPFIPTDVNDMHSPASSTSGESVDSLAQSFEKEGLVLLKKKEEDLFSGVIKPRTGKRSKKDKKRTTQNKLIHHTPQTLSQFARLEIRAPPTAMEVSEAIQQLESKKQYFESLPPPATPSLQIVPSSSDGSSQGSATPSVVESAFTESIPSTPEVYSENSHPGFPAMTTRRMSHDSGAYELEEDSDCSIEKATITADSVVTNEVIPAAESPTKDSFDYERITSRESNISVESADSSASSGGTVIENTNRSIDSPASVDCTGDHESIAIHKEGHPLFQEALKPLSDLKGDHVVSDEPLALLSADMLEGCGVGENDVFHEQFSQQKQQAARDESEKIHAHIKEGEKQTDPLLSDKEFCDKNEVVLAPSIEQTGELQLSATKVAEVSSSS